MSTRQYAVVPFILYASAEKIQNETVAVLKGTRTDKQILKVNQDIEVVILGLETVGLLKSKYKKTYVQVKWKPHHAESRKVKTFRREDTDNPMWGTRGKFVFQNCEPNGEFKVKVKEVRSLKRKVVVGTARLPSDVIPRDGSRVDLRASSPRGAKGLRQYNGLRLFVIENWRQYHQISCLTIHVQRSQIIRA